MPIDDILNDLENQIIDDDTSVPQDTDDSGKQGNDKAQDTPDKTTDDDGGKQAVITEKLVELAGLPKELVGKPIEMLAYSYRNLNDKLQEVTQKKDTSQKDTTPSIYELEIPDQVTEPEQFQKYMQSLISYMKQLEDKVKAIPQLQETIVEQQANTVVNKALSMLKRELGDDVDVKEVVKLWYKENEDLIPGFEASGVFKNRPERLAKLIADHYRSKAVNKKTPSSHKEIINKLKQSNNDFSPTFPRQQKTDSGVVGDILNDLLDEELLKNSTE